MTRPIALAVLAIVAGCFSEPGSSSSSGSTGASEPSSSASTTGSDTTDPGTTDSGDESSTGFGFGTSSTGFFGSSTGFADTGVAETGKTTPQPFDLFEQCELGHWTSLSADTAGTPATCTHAPMDPHDVGGGWRFPSFLSPTFGEQDRVLVLRPNPVLDGIVQVRFDIARIGVESGDTLRFDYEFVNTRPMVDDIGAMVFQVLHVTPDGPGTPIVLQDSDEALSGSFEMPLELTGPEDDIVFFVLAEAPVEGQGVALYDAVIEPAP